MKKPTVLLASALAIFAVTAGAQTTGMLGLGEIESRMTAQGITIREIELHDRVVEVEGRDAQGRKVELLIDRRSGEILSQKPDR